MRLHLNSLRKVQCIGQRCDGAAIFCDGAATKMDKTLSALGFSFAALRGKICSRKDAKSHLKALSSNRVAHRSLKIGTVVSTQRKLLAVLHDDPILPMKPGLHLFDLVDLHDR